MAQRLTQIGLADVRVDAIPAEDRTCYSGWTTAKAWDVECGRLTVVSPEQYELADWHDIPQHVVMRSESAHGIFPVVPWNSSNERDMRGLVAFTHERPAEVQHRLKSMGGLGLISDFLPDLQNVRSRDEAQDHVLWEQVCFRPNPGGMWGFMISPKQGLRLEKQLRCSEVRVAVDLNAHCYEGVTHAIDAVLLADSPTGQQILLVAHLYEPGANDNASGAGLVIEVLRAITDLQRSGKIRLRRSIRVLMAYEGRGTIAWVHRHEADCRLAIAGLNLDEIGVDQTVGRSAANIFLPPHSNPSFVGDLLLEIAKSLPSDIRWKLAADRADIILDTRLSDPNINIPIPCMIQYPASVYHTSKDSPDVLSPRVLGAFGTIAAEYLLRLATLGEKDASELDALLVARATIDLKRMRDDRSRTFLRERLEFKQQELVRWGVLDLPRLSQLIQPLPQTAVPVGYYSRFIPRRLTLASPGGTQIADILDGDARSAFRTNLLNHGLDLVFHHFFYWADGRRNLEEICERIEDETVQSERTDFIPRTTTGILIHHRKGRIDRRAALLMYQQLAAAGFVELQEVNLP